jgi:meiosis arrest female protein 1
MPSIVRQDSLCSHVDQLRFFDFLEPNFDFKTAMSRFERQVSWLPLVAPTAELESSPIENNTTFESIWQPKSSFLPTLPETPPSFADDYHHQQQQQISIDSIIDERNLTNLLSPPPPPLMKTPLPTRSKLPIRSQEKNSRAISPSPYESSLPSQKRTKSSTNIHENESFVHGASQTALEVAALLKEHPGYMCPMLTLVQEYQSRFCKPLHMSELNTARDIIEIQYNGHMGFARLSSAFRATIGNDALPVRLERPYCTIHCPSNFVVSSTFDLPFVRLPLQLFSDNIHFLLSQHNKAMPLGSFVQCYSHYFPRLIDDEYGVPLEHYITCVKNVEIVTDQGVIKRVQTTITPSFSVPLNHMVPDKRSSSSSTCSLQTFAREVIDLLKQQTIHCRLPLSKFVTTYHMKYSRHCRSADYGFDKILDLLLAIPNAVQVLGDGNKRILTLTHRCQVKRFFNDLVRILKNKPQRSMAISEIPKEFTNFSKKPFDIIDFGVCYLDDLIGELKDNKEVVIDQELGIIKLYRKEQTDVEKFATQIFADDIINMFRHQQDFNIPFQRFIPMYHHHFGYQCRVQLYGCLRLIDLLEEIPHIVQIIEDKNGERIIQLTDDAIRQAVLLNIIQLIRQHEGSIGFDQLKKFYAEMFRFELNYEEIGFDSIESMIESMQEKLTCVQINKNTVVIRVLEEHHSETVFARNVVHILMEAQGETTIWLLKQEMANRYRRELKIEDCQNRLKQYIELIGQNVRLTPPMQFAYEVVKGMRACGLDKMNYEDFLIDYQLRHGNVHCPNPAEFGYPTIDRLFNAIRIVVLTRGHRQTKTISLTDEFRMHIRPSYSLHLNNPFAK